jgi:hypothetical protein
VYVGVEADVVVDGKADNLYKERPPGPPQTSVALPAQFMLHRPSVARVEEARTALSQ